MNLAPSIQFYPELCSCPCISLFDLGISEGSLPASENQNSEEKWTAFGPGGSKSERLGPVVSVPWTQIRERLVGWGGRQAHIIDGLFSENLNFLTGHSEEPLLAKGSLSTSQAVQFLTLVVKALPGGQRPWPLLSVLSYGGGYRIFLGMGGTECWDQADLRLFPILHRRGW